MKITEMTRNQLAGFLTSECNATDVASMKMETKSDEELVVLATVVAKAKGLDPDNVPPPTEVELPKPRRRSARRRTEPEEEGWGRWALNAIRRGMGHEE